MKKLTAGEFLNSKGITILTCYTDGNVTYYFSDMVDLLHEFSEQEKWIDVNEELPEETGNNFSDSVLILNSRTRIQWIRCYDYEFKSWNLPIGAENPTHWQPLPKPPTK